MATRRPLVVVNGVTSELPSGDTTPTNSVAPGTARQLLQTNAGGTATEWTSNIDVPGTLDVTGATTLNSTLNVAGNVSLGAAATLTFEGATDDAFETTLSVTDPTADRSIVLPNVSGTVITTGDTGSVTSTMIADGTIVNADINASAAIAGTKISPDFGSQNVSTTGTSTSASFIPTSSTVPTNGVYLPAANSVAISTNGTGRLFVDSSGRVGIGATPSYKLDVDNTNGGTATARLVGNDQSNVRLRIQNTGAGGRTYEIVGGVHVANNSHFSIYDATAAATRLTITDTGAVGIGSTAPQALLHVEAPSPAILLKASNTVSGNVYSDYNLNGNIGYVGDANWNFGGSRSDFGIRATSNLVFGIGANERARIDSSGRLLVGTSSARANFYNSSNTSTFQVEGTNAVSGFGRISSVYNDNSANGGSIIIGKTRGASIGAVTAVSDGDSLGSLSFQGADGAELVEAASISVAVDGTPGANDMPGRLVFSVSQDGSASPTERLRIGNNGVTSVYTNFDFVVATASTSGASGAFRLLNGASSTSTGTAACYIYADGDIENTNNSYGAFSDIKLKENIVDATSQWNDLKSLQVRKYNFKEETGHQTHTQIGLIAQEVELVSPGLVSESPDRDAEGNDLGTVTKSVNYSVLYMKAVKALQEAMERIETLEAKVAALESA